jgi:hypothetical protein
VRDKCQHQPSRRNQAKTPLCEETEQGEGDLAEERSKARWERGSTGGGLLEGEHAPSSSHRSSP